MELSPLVLALMEDLRFDEGTRNKVYKDSRGKPTVGTGHLVRPEDNLSLGDVVDKDRMNIFFNKDITKAIAAARKKVLNFDSLPMDFQRGMANFMFQLGENADKKFPTAFKHLGNGNYAAGVKELTVDGGGSKPSLWMKQTPNRALRTVDRLNTGLGSIPRAPDPNLLQQKDIDAYDKYVGLPEDEFKGLADFNNPTAGPQSTVTLQGAGGLPTSTTRAYDGAAPPEVENMLAMANYQGPSQEQIVQSLNRIGNVVDRGKSYVGNKFKQGLNYLGNAVANSAQPIPPTPFEEEMLRREALAEQAGPPPTTAPQQYTDSAGNLLDGRLYLSNPGAQGVRPRRFE